jgi:hypothetical protein
MTIAEQLSLSWASYAGHTYPFSNFGKLAQSPSAVSWLPVAAAADEGMWLFNARHSNAQENTISTKPQWLRHLQKASVRQFRRKRFIRLKRIGDHDHHVGADIAKISGQSTIIRDGYAKRRRKKLNQPISS